MLEALYFSFCSCISSVTLILFFNTKVGGCISGLLPGPVWLQEWGPEGPPLCAWLGSAVFFEA